ncbi:hypothetical protein AXA44_02660 [Rhodococcus sp. SC4]|nr:hypothetical protein AXA44_02660 [Rhodococcus sp. SC4]
MAIAGRKPKPEGQRVNRHALKHDWTDVPDVPFEGAPKLPSKRLQGKSWPTLTRRWWKAVSTMPHCVLWTDSDWQFAMDTALIAAEFHDGDVKASTELRSREKLLGTTMDFRRDLRLRYVDPQAFAGATPADDDAPTGVARMDDYRDVLGG